MTGTLIAQNLLSSQGIWWLLSNMVNNFIKFPPLAIVSVGMSGIGLAERSGFLPALLRRSIMLVPQSLLTPTTIFIMTNDEKAIQLEAHNEMNRYVIEYMIPEKKL